MKYINFKRFKFSTIFKNINFKWYEGILAHVAEFVIFIIKYVFSRIYKSFKFTRHYFLKTYNNIDFKKYNFSKIFKFVGLKRLDFNKAYKFLSIGEVDFYEKIKKIILINYKYLLIYFTALVIFSGNGPELPIHVVQPYPTVLNPNSFNLSVKPLSSKY